MPGERKKEKKKVGVWLTPAEISLLKETAGAYHCTEADLFRRTITEAAKKKGIINGREKDIG